MPRPTRIEYQGAFHHVMNRGRAHQTIFHDKAYFEAFLCTIEEASTQFDAIFHAYCLMSNHYHLLVETPKANLSRIMRHINGVYTQRHNRLRKTDGPLFRGRYKSILVDEDAYLLQLSRYIHRNPIEITRPMVNQLEDYPWSSYPAYINKTSATDWLCREKIYQMLGKRKKYQGYKAYVAQGVDEEIHQYYNKGNILSVLGDNDFREFVKQETQDVDLKTLRTVLQDRPDADEIIAMTARIFKIGEKAIRKKPVGRRISNSARAFAMYACQYYGMQSLKEIAETFELTNSGSASFSINLIKKQVATGELEKVKTQFEKSLYIIK